MDNGEKKSTTWQTLAWCTRNSFHMRLKRDKKLICRMRQNNVPTVLNVAEKPSVARALASVFARLPNAVDRGMRREGNQVFSHENVCFPSVFSQGNGVCVQGPIVPHSMITTSVRGHLASQDFPPAYGWSKCDPIALFEAPIETSYRDDMQPLERMLKSLSRQAQVLILWLDCDREGEAIGDEVRTVCLGSNSRLQVYRARFSTVLPVEIERALQTLGRVNEYMVAAVQARSTLDLRVGAAFTRFQTLRLQRKFDGFAEQGVISYGPCQFPTLGFVVERWARIETFIPEDFWHLELAISVDDTYHQQSQEEDQSAARGRTQQNRTIHFSWKRGYLYDKLLTTVLFEECLEAGEAVVTAMNGRTRNKWRPVPLATVELQKRASMYLRIGSETLMSAAEELYQQGYISYPRTETERFRPEFEHRPLIQQFSSLQGEFGAYASKLLNENGFQIPRAGKSDDQAHPPITPAKAVDPNTIQDQIQRKIYSLIVKHYLACCSRDAVGRGTTLTVRMGTEEFNATGLMVIEKNWLEIYSPWERWGSGQGELPPLQVGSRIRPTSFLMKEGRSGPPQPISEVELISLMDRNGIGTDATIAQHISTILDREYARKDGRQKFLPTPLGIALVEGYNSMGYQLNKPDLRREMEAECNEVASGRKTKEEIMVPILAKMKSCYETARAEARKLDEAVARHFPRLGAGESTSQVVEESFSECGVCRNSMALKQERENNNRTTARNTVRRKLLYCSTCRAGWTLPRGVVRPKTEQEDNGPPVKCPICQFQVIRILRGEGYEGNGYHVCPKCFSDPPSDHGGASNAGDFRCFACQHPTCALASGTPGGDVEVFRCPFCHPSAQPTSTSDSGKVCVRKTSRGYVLSCNKYVRGQDRCSYTIWLPKECHKVSVLSGDENQNEICGRCSSPRAVIRKVHFVWKPGSVPPHLGRECTVCVLCDADFRRELNISLPQMNQVQSRPRTTAGRAGHRGGGGTETGQGGAGNTCFHCGQPGHFANSCPNR